jgi:acyl carrier protein
MSGMRNAVLAANEASIAFLDTPKGTCRIVMSVLREIRPLQSNGLAYDENTNLTDAGFTSVEMVKVMLSVEAAFDLMIPQYLITPEHFTNASAIGAMIDTLRS